MTSGRGLRTGIAGTLFVATMAMAGGTASGAATGPQAAPASGGQSVQQQYDAATALDAQPDANASLAAWTALTARVKQGGRTWAIAMVRKGRAQARLGQLDEAAATVRAGLAVLPQADATLAVDRSNAHALLGEIAIESLDYADAAAEYAKSEATSPDDVGRLAAMLGAARAQIFIDPAAAQVTLDRAEALAPRMTLGKVDQAALMQARMRLALNQGDFDTANRIAPKIITLLGGMGLDKVDLRDVAARSDAAIAAMLVHHEEKAREYMAYTGAGRAPKGEFGTGNEMMPPECGGEADLKPEDVAIVQFSVGGDGRVIGVEPIYAAGGGAKALAFARAVRGWSWSPEALKDLPSFFRYNVRLELRCSTAFSRPSVGQGFETAFGEWLVGKGVTIAPSGPRSAAAVLPLQRTALAAAEAKGQAPAILAAIDALRSNVTLGDEERQALLDRAERLIVTQSDMPAMARLNLALPARLSRSREWWRDGRYAATVMPLLTEKPYVDDPQARASLRLMIADYSKESLAKPLLENVAGDAALDAHDPLKVGALIRLASIAQRHGNSALARETFARSGLAASQCATLDAAPKPLSFPGSSAFPMEAQRWGFEGWVSNQFDIDADGHLRNVRTLVSYPPFIFSDAARKLFMAGRYTKTYRPDGGLGCGASVNRVRFRLPG